MNDKWAKDFLNKDYYSINDFNHYLKTELKDKSFKCIVKTSKGTKVGIIGQETKLMLFAKNDGSEQIDTDLIDIKSPAYGKITGLQSTETDSVTVILQRGALTYRVSAENKLIFSPAEEKKESSIVIPGTFHHQREQKREERQPLLNKSCCVIL